VVRLTLVSAHDDARTTLCIKGAGRQNEEDAIDRDATCHISCITLGSLFPLMFPKVERFLVFPPFQLNGVCNIGDGDMAIIFLNLLRDCTLNVFYLYPLSLNVNLPQINKVYIMSIVLHSTGGLHIFSCTSLQACIHPAPQWNPNEQHCNQPHPKHWPTNHLRNIDDADRTSKEVGNSEGKCHHVVVNSRVLAAQLHYHQPNQQRTYEHKQ